MQKTIKIRFSGDRRDPGIWTGSLKAACDIALAEIHEHAGGDSAAYAFTAAIVDRLQKALA